MIHGNYVIDSEVTFGNERQLATSSCCARVQYQVLTHLRFQALNSSCLNTTTSFHLLHYTPDYLIKPYVKLGCSVLLLLQTLPRSGRCTQGQKKSDTLQPRASSLEDTVLNFVLEFLNWKKSLRKFFAFTYFLVPTWFDKNILFPNSTSVITLAL